MAEIIRPFASGENSSEAQIKADPKLLAYRLEIEKLEGQRAELLNKYEDARRTLESEKALATNLSTRLKRTEQLLAQEQSRQKKAHEIVSNYQKNWAQMVENEKKLRGKCAELQQNLNKIEAERQKHLNDKSSCHRFLF